MLRRELLSVCQAYAESQGNIFNCNKTVWRLRLRVLNADSHPIIDTWVIKSWNLGAVLDTVAVDCIALKYSGKHKRKMAIRGIN